MSRRRSGADRYKGGSHEGCAKMVDAGRRKFLTGAGLAAAGVAAARVPSLGRHEPLRRRARVDYPSNRLANVRDLKVDEPLRGGLSGSGCARRAPEARQAGAHRRRSRRRHRRLLDDLSAQRISAQLQQIRSHPELSRSLLPLRLRCGRPADLGPSNPKPPAVRAAHRRQRRHLRRRRRVERVCL